MSAQGDDIGRPVGPARLFMRSPRISASKSIGPMAGARFSVWPSRGNERSERCQTEVLFGRSGLDCAKLQRGFILITSLVQNRRARRADRLARQIERNCRRGECESTIGLYRLDLLGRVWTRAQDATKHRVAGR